MSNHTSSPYKSNPYKYDTHVYRKTPSWRIQELEGCIQCNRQSINEHEALIARLKSPLNLFMFLSSRGMRTGAIEGITDARAEIRRLELEIVSWKAEQEALENDVKRGIFQSENELDKQEELQRDRSRRLAVEERKLELDQKEVDLEVRKKARLAQQHERNLNEEKAKLNLRLAEINHDLVELRASQKSTSE